MSSRSHAMKSTIAQLTEATEASQFTYPPSVTDMMRKSSSPSQRTQETDPSTSAFSSSLSSSAFNLAAPFMEDIHVHPLPGNPYCFEESDEEEDREKKAAKKHKKKKKKSKKHEKGKEKRRSSNESDRQSSMRRSSNESSDRQSSRRSVESSESHHKRSSSKRQSRRRQKGLGPLEETLSSPRKERRERRTESEQGAEYVASPRKERRERRRATEPTASMYPDSPLKERHERGESIVGGFMLETSDEFLRNRRERQERLREEGVDVKTVERWERRNEDGSELKGRRHHHHPRADSVGATLHLHHVGTGHRHHSDSHIHAGHPQEIELDLPFPGEVNCAAASLPVGQKPTSSRSTELWSPRTRRTMNIPTTIDVPPFIDVIVEHPPVDQRKKTKSERKSRRPNSDYDRLRQLLHEQSDKSDSDTDTDPSRDQPKMLDKLHPLIAASDEEFQEAFDNLAKDSVFDDNFEKAFNEFSEHYLALSPWGEDDSLKDKCGKPTEQDFIQIPLTPVSREGIANYVAKDKKYYHADAASDMMPRTPVIEKGYLTPADLDGKHETRKKEDQDKGEGFVEVSRTPYCHTSSNSGASTPSSKTPQGDDQANEVVHETSGHSSRARSEPCHDVSDGKRRHKWGILRGRRQTSKATV